MLDTKEDLIICVMFGSLVVYTALLSQGTLGFANAIFGVALIVGIVGVSSIAIFVCASSIVDAFDFFIGGTTPQMIVDPAVAVIAFQASLSFCSSNPFCTPSMIAVIIGTAD